MLFSVAPPDMLQFRVDSTGGNHCMGEMEDLYRAIVSTTPAPVVHETKGATDIGHLYCHQHFAYALEQLNATVWDGSKSVRTPGAGELHAGPTTFNNLWGAIGGIRGNMAVKKELAAFLQSGRVLRVEEGDLAHGE